MDLTKELQKFAKGQKILFVEDEESIRENIRDILELFYLEVDIAVDGLDGLEKFKEKEYNIVLSDITMPNMNGVDMIENIKKLDWKVSLAVFSANREIDYIIKLIDIGIDQFIPKPFEYEVFLERMLKISKKVYLERKLQELNDVKKEEKKRSKFSKNKTQTLKQEDIKEVEELDKKEDVTDRDIKVNMSLRNGTMRQ